MMTPVAGALVCAARCVDRTSAALVDNRAGVRSCFDRDSFSRLRECQAPEVSGFFANLAGLRGAGTAVPRPQRVELHPARVAAVCRKPQNALQWEHPALFDAAARDSLDTRIAATRAMRLQQQPEGNFVCVETRLAGRTAPGQYSDQAQRNVAQVAPARSSALACFTERTNHGTSPQFPNFRPGNFSVADPSRDASEEMPRRSSKAPPV